MPYYYRGVSYLQGCKLFFSLKPKTDIRNLYDREFEISELDNSLSKKEPIIVVSGIRRVGKTSLVRAYLNSRNIPYIWIDLRSALVDENYVDDQEITRQLEKGLSSLLPRHKKLKEGLKAISGISIFGVSVKFSEAVRQSTIISILETLDKIARERVIIVLDEAQYLRFLRQLNLLNIMAYAYDNLQNIGFILTGSEVGLLEEYLKLDDPKSPLYGRFIRVIKVKRFTKEQAMDYLVKGFKEAKMTPDIGHIESIVDALDGIVGWLSLYGYIAVDKGNPNLPYDVFKERAFKLIKSELDKLLKKSKYYKLILKAIALGNTAWSEIKEYIEYKLKRRINDSTLARYLKKLVKHSIIRRKEKGRKIQYEFEDHLIKSYAKTLRT